MKKGFKYYIICWAVLFALFNLLCFATPNELHGYTKFGGAFWAGHVCISLAMIGQLICAYFAFREQRAQKRFYKLPLITISYSAMIVSFVLSTLCMLIPDLPNAVGIVVCALLLAFSAIAIVKATVAAEIVSSVDEKIKTKTEFVKTLTIEAEGLMLVANGDSKDELKKIYEALRYSDPMSSPELSEIEAKIESAFAELKTADGADGTRVAEKLLLLIEERNRKCKLLK